MLDFLEAGFVYEYRGEFFLGYEYYSIFGFEANSGFPSVNSSELAWYKIVRNIDNGDH